MKKLIAPLAVVLLISVGACGSSGSSTSPGSAAKQNSSAPQESEQKYPRDVKFGETAGASHNSSRFAITVDAPKDFTKFTAPPEEGKYISINVKAQLLEGQGGAVAATSFTLVDAAGTEYPNAAPNGTDMNGMLFAGLLTVGESGSGLVVFDVPVKAGTLTVKFTPIGSTGALASWS